MVRHICLSISIFFFLLLLFSCGDEDEDNDGAENAGELLWKYKTDNSVLSSPCVSDGVVYIGSSDGYLYAIKTDSYKGLSKSKFSKKRQSSFKSSFSLPTNPTE